MSAGGASLVGRFVAALRTCGLQPSNRVAVALSGGPDSLALASMTVWWQGFVRNKQPPLALIVDHQLRPESSEEAQAVARQAEALGMQTRLLTVKWPEGQLPSMGDKMAAAREARYALLLRACGELGRSHLLLAHHADDQAETFLLRLMHASGVAGLACMPRVVEKRTDFGRVKLVRPLLEFHKAELEEYCQRGGLEYVTDPTNAELSFHRNRIRHVLQQMPESPPDEEALAAAAAEAEARSSSSSSWSSVGIWEAEADAAAGFRSNSSSSDGTPIVQDILRLQRRCDAAMQWQQLQGDFYLERAVLRSNRKGLPRWSEKSAWQYLPPPPQLRNRWARKAQKAYGWQEDWLEQQPWYIDWEERLAQVAYQLRSIPYVLLDAAAFEGLSEAVAVGALGRVLQAVSGRPYPPPLAHSVRLHQLLLGGRLDHVFTGGGCLVRSLPRCKARYLVVVAQGNQERAEQLLARLPPLNAAEAARQQRRKEEKQAAAEAAGATEAEQR